MDVHPGYLMFTRGESPTHGRRHGYQRLASEEPLLVCLELTGKATLVALIDRCIGAVIRYMLIAVIPDIFQRLQVVLNVWILAVANETTVR